MEYLFVKAKPSMMRGFDEISIEGQSANMADLEKALFDFLHFRKDSYTVDILIEKLKEVRDEIDANKIIELSKNHPITLRRRLGFLLDLTGIDSEQLACEIRGTPGFAKLTKKSIIFNAKWRLYHEDRFAQ
ncbi:MAG: hypothetical protein ACYC4D_05745 [Thermoleophilia bacterium]